MVNCKYYRIFILLCFLTLIALMPAGCISAERKYTVSDLESTEPAVRIMAIKWAGDNKVSSALPQLVECLQSDDKSVRFYAVGALRRITGTDRGYDYKAAANLRAAAVEHWREFLDTNGVAE